MTSQLISVYFISLGNVSHHHEFSLLHMKAEVLNATVLEFHCDIGEENHQNCLSEVYLGFGNKWGKYSVQLSKFSWFLIVPIHLNIARHSSDHTHTLSEY